ncbi:MAG: MFS transporter, partial [Chloroflexi bacterium]|nr:MFS transporter [Chloroflexota bacterium]
MATFAELLVTLPRAAPLETLASPGYRHLWGASFLWNQARWMDRVVLGWVVLEMTNSAWNLAIIEALRWLPLLIFGLMGGAIADRIDRRWVLIGAQSMALVVCSVVAVLLALGVFNFGLAALATFLLGVQWAVDWPTRRALIPDLVGRRLTSNAVALEALSQNITRIVGPLIAGVLVAYWSSSAAFACMAVLYVIEIVLLKRMPLSGSLKLRPPGQVPMLRYLLDGFATLRYSEPIVGVLLISVFMNVLVFPYQQLLPVFARDTLHVDAVGLGALSSAAGLGSVLGALAIVGSVRVPRSAQLFWMGSALMGVGLALFAVTDHFVLALVLLGVSGLGQAAFSALQTTIVLSTATDDLRGRAMGALTLAIGTTPFGSLEVGAVAAALGAPFAVALNAGACAILVALVA